MARLARAELFDPAEVSVFHCINRCVRRCFLCGDDPLTGHNYDHRKRWLEGRLRFLAGQFGIDVLRERWGHPSTRSGAWSSQPFTEKPVTSNQALKNGLGGPFALLDRTIKGVRTH